MSAKIQFIAHTKHSEAEVLSILSCKAVSTTNSYRRFERL